MASYDRGSATLTNDYSKNYALIEKIAKQVILNVESTNKLQWFDKGKIIHGKSIEQAVVQLAEGYEWKDDEQNGSNLNAPNYPDIVVRYFKTWNGRQFKTTVSESQIDKVILAGGSEKDLSEKIVSSLTEGEGDEDYITSKGLLLDGIQGSNIVKFSNPDDTGHPNGNFDIDSELIIAIKNISDNFQYVNQNFVGAGYRTRCPFNRIHIIMPYSVYNKMNIDVLASLYNLSKAELTQKITLIDEGTKVFIVDEWGLLKYTRVYRMTSKYIEDGLYSNYWLTVDRMYATSGLFKMAYLETSATGNTTVL